MVDMLSVVVEREGRVILSGAQVCCDLVGMHVCRVNVPGSKAKYLP